MAVKFLSNYDVRRFMESCCNTQDMCHKLEMQSKYDTVVSNDEELSKLNRAARYAIEEYRDALEKRFDGLREPLFGTVMNYKNNT